MLWLYSPTRRQVLELNHGFAFWVCFIFRYVWGDIFWMCKKKKKGKSEREKSQKSLQKPTIYDVFWKGDSSRYAHASFSTLKVLTALQYMGQEKGKISIGLISPCFSVICIRLLVLKPVLIHDDFD